MPKIDITKHATPDSVHYESMGGAVFETDIALLRNVTPAGRAFFARAGDFCRMERTIIARSLVGKPINKPELCREFGFPGRMVNAAIDSARGLVDSTQACAQLAFADTTEALTRALAHYLEAQEDPARHGELHGRRRNIQRLVQQEARHAQRLLRPRVFPGRAFFANQHKMGWKAAYREARADHLSANGGADEAAGNKTLRVSTSRIEVIKDRLWQWFSVSHAGETLASFRLPANDCANLTRVVTTNAAPVKLADAETWFDAGGKRIGTQTQARMAKAGLRPAATKPVKRAVTVGRIGLTIDLRRRAQNGRWYLHVSRQADNLPKVFTPTGWTGVDLNCDSVAWADVSIEAAAPQIVRYAKEHFPASGPAGARAMRLHQIINAVVERAAAQRRGISLEYLDFEHGKRWLKTKLGAMLRVMPYRQIRAAFERRCRELGVPLRYVPPKYTSLIGAVISEKWSALGRDQAAAVVIALRADATGNRWLERTCEQVAKAEKVSLRLNAKGKYGHTLRVAAAPPPASTGEGLGRQMDSPTQPTEPALKWQVAGGRKVSAAFSTLSTIRAEWLRERRRAANAQGRIHHTLRPKMPAMIILPPEGARRTLRSTLRKAA